MNLQQQQKQLTQLPARLKAHTWVVRKEAYQQVLDLVGQLTHPGDTFSVGKQLFTPQKLIPFLQDLVDEDHPNVLLAGLQCVEQLLTKELSFGKQFHKLFDQGLDKFPLRTSKRKEIIQKFADILLAASVEPNLLSLKLGHPNEKCVMFVLEIVGYLNYKQLAKKIKKMIDQHSKQCVRELASQIYEELMNDGEQPEIQQIENIEPKKKKQEENHKTRNRIDLIEKLPKYDQLKNKEQQQYSSQLLQIFKTIEEYPQNQLITLSHVIRLMIEDNNIIVSTNGLKMLKMLIQSDSNLLPRSYPLLFIFLKFKLHSTHPVNTLLCQLTDLILNTERASDLFQAICDGSSSTKANVRYGAAIVLVRSVLLINKESQMFYQLCQGQYSELADGMGIKKKLQKVICKCYDLLNGDKKYGTIVKKVKSYVYSGFTTTSINSYSQKTLSSVRPKIQTNRKADLAKTKSTSVMQQYKIMNPQQKINKILILAQSNKIPQLQKAINSSLKQCEECVEEGRFQLYYYCELIDSFIRRYEPTEQTATLVSQYLIEYLLIVTRLKKKITDSSTMILLFQICLCTLAIGNKIKIILGNMCQRCEIEVLVKGLMGIQGKVKKKNRKYVLEWIDQNVASEYMSTPFLQVLQSIENGKELNAIERIPEVDEEILQEKEMMGLDQVQISKIDHEEEMVSPSEKTDAKWEYFLDKHQMNKPNESHISSFLNQSNSPFQDSLHQSHHEKSPSHQYSSPSKNSNELNSPSKYSSHESEHVEPSSTVIQYKSYIKEIRQKYLPPEYLRSGEKSNEKPKIQQKPKEEVSIEKAELSIEKEELGEQKSLQFRYEYLDDRKLNYMLSNTVNPYSHLRNQILIPFKHHSNKHQFLSEFIHYLMHFEIYSEQAYNGLLLTVILLFAQIKGNKDLIGPLQQLYEYMASLYSTNKFLKTIIGLFHSVIEETTPQMRSFLITILTKSVARLMPFVEQPVQLLRDLCQFYNIGENVYFDMYEDQYGRIKTTIEGQALHEVVEKAMIQEGEHFISVVEGWFDTQLKLQVKAYIKQIIEENEN